MVTDVLLAVVVVAAVVWTLLFTFVRWRRRRRLSGSVKTLIVLGSGGHTAEMLALVSPLDKEVYNPRVYVVASTDVHSERRVRDFDEDAIVAVIPRAREVGQSWISSAWTTLVSLAASYKLLLAEDPQLVLVNGPGTCVPVCLGAWLNSRLLHLGPVKIVFVESVCRVKTPSLTGKILAPFADEFLVQWPELAGSCKKAAKYVARFV